MNIWKKLSNQEGAIAILVAVCAVVLLSLAAFVIDGGFGLVTRNELKNVADGSALAGTRLLGDIYCCRGMTPAQQQTYVLTGEHRAEIIDYGRRQRAGKPMGSGRMEKGVDQVIGVRQQHKGMSWSPTGSKALGILQVVELNQQWEQLWFPQQVAA